jgi:hypothetical protein
VGISRYVHFNDHMIKAIEGAGIDHGTNKKVNKLKIQTLYRSHNQRPLVPKKVPLQHSLKALTQQFVLQSRNLSIPIAAILLIIPFK